MIKQTKTHPEQIEIFYDTCLRFRARINKLEKDVSERDQKSAGQEEDLQKYKKRLQDCQDSIRKLKDTFKKQEDKMDRLKTVIRSLRGEKTAKASGGGKKMPGDDVVNAGVGSMGNMDKTELKGKADNKQGSDHEADKGSNEDANLGKRKPVVEQEEKDLPEKETQDDVSDDIEDDASMKCVVPDKPEVSQANNSSLKTYKQVAFEPKLPSSSQGKQLVSVLGLSATPKQTKLMNKQKGDVVKIEFSKVASHQAPSKEDLDPVQTPIVPKRPDEEPRVAVDLQSRASIEVRQSNKQPLNALHRLQSATMTSVEYADAGPQQTVREAHLMRFFAK